MSGGRGAEQRRRDADVLGDGHVRKQRRALKHVADAAPKLDWIAAADILAADADDTGIGIDQAVGEAQQRGLAGAGAADDAAEFALADIQRDVAQSLYATAVEALADVHVTDRWRGCAHDG